MTGSRAAAAACPVIIRNSIISVMHLLLLTWQGEDIVMCGVSLLATGSVLFFASCWHVLGFLTRAVNAYYLCITGGPGLLRWYAMLIGQCIGHQEECTTGTGKPVSPDNFGMEAVHANCAAVVTAVAAGTTRMMSCTSTATGLLALLP